MQHVRDTIWSPKSSLPPSSSPFTLLRESSTSDHVMILHYAWQTRIQGFASVRDYMTLTLSVSCVQEYKASLQPVSCVEEYKALLQPVSCVQTQSSLKQQSTLATKLSVAASNLKIKAAINFSHDPQKRTRKQTHTNRLKS
ncbi:hypothetical protein YC2023_083376 [Brassica napus]